VACYYYLKDRSLYLLIDSVATEKIALFIIWLVCLLSKHSSQLILCNIIYIESLLIFQAIERINAITDANIS